MRKTNLQLIELMGKLKEKSRSENVRIWRDIAKRLEKPRRNYAAVNLSRINRYSMGKEVIVVPGKVLGAGELEHPVTIAALDFSASARRKLSIMGRCLSIDSLMEENPKGSGVKVIK
jgi:large subunit ribosomal protein L18e